MRQETQLNDTMVRTDCKKNKASFEQARMEVGLVWGAGNIHEDKTLGSVQMLVRLGEI